MKCRLIIFLIILLFSRFAFADPTDIRTCRSWNREDWDTFVQNNLIREITRTSPAEVMRRTSLARELCSENISRLGVDSCLQRISGYASNFNREGGMFTSQMSDAEYYRRQPERLMELPRELQSARNGLPRNWRAIAERNGWQWALFHSGTADEPRLIIRIPRNGYTQLLVYYTFNRTNADPTTYEGLQMQAIEPQPSGGPRIHFRSWDFEGAGNTPRRAVSGGRCVTCHISGPREIVPQSNPSFPTQLSPGMTLQSFNREMTSGNTLPNYREFYNMEHFPEFLKVETTGRCNECHNGFDRMSLAFNVNEHGRFNSGNIHRKLVTERSMPEGRGNDIDLRRRVSLVDEIAIEHTQQIREWLGEPCRQPVGPASANQRRANEQSEATR